MDGFNRFLLLLLGLLLIAGGVIGLLAAGGWLPLLEPGAIYQQSVDAVNARPSLWWTVIVVGALLLMLLGLLLAWGQISPPRGHHSTPRSVTIERTNRGRTTLDAAALARAATLDLRRIPNVTGGRARFDNFGRRPRLLASLDLEADADLAAVRQNLEEVYGRLCRFLDVDRLQTSVRLRPTEREPTRVE
jgi:hypothetical protein